MFHRVVAFGQVGEDDLPEWFVLTVCCKLRNVFHHECFWFNLLDEIQGFEEKLRTRISNTLSFSSHRQPLARACPTVQVKTVRQVSVDALEYILVKFDRVVCEADEGLARSKVITREKVMRHERIWTQLGQLFDRDGKNP